MLSVLILQASTKVNVSSPRFTGLVSLSVPVEDIDKPQTFRAKPVKARLQVKHLPQSCFIVLDYCLFLAFISVQDFGHFGLISRVHVFTLEYGTYIFIYR